jgi:repressor LexA
MTYLTERQRDILQFIRDFQKERGVTPTHREICDHFGFSSYGTVYKHLSLLQKKGLIRRDWNQKRGVEVIEQNGQDGQNASKTGSSASAGVLELPLFGYIAAGRPLDVEVSNETITCRSGSPAAARTRA